MGEVNLLNTNLPNVKFMRDHYILFYLILEAFNFPKLKKINSELGTNIDV